MNQFHIIFSVILSFILLTFFEYSFAGTVQDPTNNNGTTSGGSNNGTCNLCNCTCQNTNAANTGCNKTLVSISFKKKKGKKSNFFFSFHKGCLKHELSIKCHIMYDDIRYDTIYIERNKYKKKSNCKRIKSKFDCSISDATSGNVTTCITFHYFVIIYIKKKI